MCFCKCFNFVVIEWIFVKFIFFFDCCNNVVMIFVVFEYNKIIGIFLLVIYVNLFKENKIFIFYNVIIVYKFLLFLIIYYYVLINFFFFIKKI